MSLMRHCTRAGHEHERTQRVVDDAPPAHVAQALRLEWDGMSAETIKLSSGASRQKGDADYYVRPFQSQHTNVRCPCRFF
jgi:hypothetical protein